MSATISTAPSPAALPVRAAQTGSDDPGIAQIAAEESSPGQFTALFQQLLAKQPSPDAAGNLALLPDETLAGTEQAGGESEFNALLPFLDALGLTQTANTAMQDALENLAKGDGDALTLAGLAASSTMTRMPASDGDALTLAGLAAGLAKQAANNPAITAANASPQSNGKGPAAGLANALAHAMNAAGAEKPDKQEAALVGEFVSQLAKSRNATGDKAPLPPTGAPAVITPQAVAQQPAPTASTAPLPALPVAQAVGAAGWNQEVGNRIVWMAHRQESRAELVLTPPHMGRVEVSLTVAGDQANAVFTSANPAVREALEAALPRLREQLADAGIQLGQAQVGAENARQSAQQEKNGDNFPFSLANDTEAGTFISTNAAPVAPAGLKMGRGFVDVFA